jgi:putative hydroxymethylpyrimidine transport system substrate-binding protein
MATRLFRTFVSAVICLVIMPMAFATTGQAADRLRVGLDWFVNPNHGPLIIALESGYFSYAGLDVELVEPTTTQDNVTMVLDGRVDIGMSDQPRTQIEVTGGSPLMIVGTLIPVPLNVILGLNGGPVKTIADLRGKRIGYADSERTERDLLKIALAAHDIAISEVTLVDVEFSMVEALLDGKVDVLTDAYRNFEPIQVSLAGKVPLIFDIEGAAIPTYSELVYIIKRHAVDADKVRRFLIAVERGVQALAEDPDRSWELFVKYDPKLDNELNRRAWAATVPLFALRAATLDGARYRRFAGFLVENELIDREVPVEDYLLGR